MTAQQQAGEQAGWALQPPRAFAQQEANVMQQSEDKKDANGNAGIDNVIQSQGKDAGKANQHPDYVRLQEQQQQQQREQQQKEQQQQQQQQREQQQKEQQQQQREQQQKQQEEEQKQQQEPQQKQKQQQQQQQQQQQMSQKSEDTEKKNFVFKVRLFINLRTQSLTLLITTLR